MLKFESRCSREWNGTPPHPSLPTIHETESNRPTSWPLLHACPVLGTAENTDVHGRMCR